MIRIDKVSKRFFTAGQPFWALEDVSFTVAQGEFVCLTGTSGSGKSTLLNIMSGILRPTTGSVHYEEVCIHTMSDRKLARYRGGAIGFVYQRFNLIPRQTIFENVRAPLLFSGLPRGEQTELTKNILERVGLSDKLYEYPPNLSGGQLQRAAIARAVIRRPRVLLADEPTGNLDEKTGDSIIQLFRELNKEGITVFTVSHDARFEKPADSVYRLNFGKLTRKSGTKGGKK